MRALWMVVGLGALGAGLGCSGLGESLIKMTGSDVQVGDNLPMPDGFPLEAPPGANVKAVMSIPAGPIKTTTVQIQVPGDGAGLLDQYEAAMAAKGMKVTRTNTGAGDTVSGEGNGDVLNASVKSAGGVAEVTLVSITGAPAGARTTVDIEVTPEPAEPVPAEPAPAEPAP